MRLLSVALPLLAAITPYCLIAQETKPNPAKAAGPSFTREQSFGITGSYSNDSSHIILGTTESRKLLESGFSYSRSLLRFKGTNLQYDAEFLPVSFLSDPVSHINYVLTTPKETYKAEVTTIPYSACRTGTTSFPISTTEGQGTETITTDCSRRWTYSPSASPIGFQWNFRDKHRWQPILMSHGGMMYSSRVEPVGGAGHWDFTFDFGAGVEWYQSAHRSWRLEYRVHHLSNKEMYGVNPGVDNGTFRLSYVFGK